jgi:hypothetical protein
MRRMNNPVPVPIMKGGAKEHILDLLKKYAQPLNIYIGIALVLGITYVKQIPDSITFRANTTIGRFLLFWLTIIIADTYSWVYALLMALFTVLVIAVSPRSLTEGFRLAEGDDDSDVSLVTEDNKWFIEKVLQETPLGTKDEKVKTSAIQDNSNSSNSTATR